MKVIQLQIEDDYLDNILDFLKLLPKNVINIKELEHLSTPLKDNEDYSKGDKPCIPYD